MTYDDPTVPTGPIGNGPIDSETTADGDLLALDRDRPDDDDDDRPDGDDLLDDDDYLPVGPQRRNRLTTALVVALIFAFGFLLGTVAGRLAGAA